MKNDKVLIVLILVSVLFISIALIRLNDSSLKFLGMSIILIALTLKRYYDLKWIK